MVGNSRPRVGLDLKACHAAAGGIGRYVVELTKALLARGRFDYLGFSGAATDTGLLRPFLPENARGLHGRVRSSLVRATFLLPRSIPRNRASLFHSMDNACVRRSSSAVRTVSTIHDLLVLKRPDWFSLKHRFVAGISIRRAVRRADHVSTVSDATRRDLIERFPWLPPERITVTHLAPADCFAPPDPQELDQFRRAQALPDRYWLAIGGGDPRKNHRRLLAAIAGEAGPHGASRIELVLLGGGAWRGPREQPPRRLGFVDDRSLALLYAGATALLYPSLDEGFGLPVLEAMACGTPVITSDLPVFREVAGQSALFVEPYSTESIRRALRSMAEDDGLRQALARHGLERARRFSWQAVAEETEEVYRRLLSSDGLPGHERLPGAGRAQR